MSNKVPIILLSVMAADERLFEYQRRAFPELVVPAWIKPYPGETLQSYACRLAQEVDPGCPCFVGGASFGGMVALEMAAHLQAVACFLICSVRSRDELPWQWRALQPLSLLGPTRLGLTAGLFARWSAPSLPIGTIRRLQRLSQPQAAFVRWASCAVLSWRPSSGVRRVPVYQIHGEVDRTLPVKFTRPDVVVPGGGHLLPVTHPQVVNTFLRQGIAVVCGDGRMNCLSNSTGPVST
jgi:pimeloyl-ACP methyl ester carboxylesterase